jgi:hypothetical protein
MFSVTSHGEAFPDVETVAVDEVSFKDAVRFGTLEMSRYGTVSPPSKRGNLIRVNPSASARRKTIRLVLAPGQVQ